MEHQRRYKDVWLEHNRKMEEKGDQSVELVSISEVVVEENFSAVKNEKNDGVIKET